MLHPRTANYKMQVVIHQAAATAWLTKRRKREWKAKARAHASNNRVVQTDVVQEV
jgi:hypothetical protein